LTASPKSRSPGVAAYYDKAAAVVPEFTVLNYGFSSDTEPTVVPADDPESCCLRLYEHTVRGAPLQGAEVLEVSCGRGGGASFLLRAFQPASYTGIDLSEENIRIAQARADGPRFMLGNAQQLAFPDGAFDIVVNIEASHLYDDRKAFFAEVHRVLRTDGHFCYTDGCWAGDDCSADLRSAGFEILERREITDNVVAALERDSERREALFDAMSSPELRDEYTDWGGVVGYRTHRRFVNRETLYFSHLLRRN
jgi:SAM-dependent methyltransferase